MPERTPNRFECADCGDTLSTIYRLTGNRCIHCGYGPPRQKLEQPPAPPARPTVQVPQADLDALFNRALGRLTSHQRQVFDLLFDGTGRTQQKVADQLDCTQPAINKTLRKIKNTFSLFGLDPGPSPDPDAPWEKNKESGGL